MKVIGTLAVAAIISSVGYVGSANADEYSNIPVDAPASNDDGSTTSKSIYYRNCAAARAAGAAPIRIGEPGYARKLDRDGDGIACE